MIFSRGCNKQVVIPVHVQSYTKYKEKYTLFPNAIGETGQLRVYSCTTPRGFRHETRLAQMPYEKPDKSQKEASTEPALVSGPHTQPGGGGWHILFGIKKKMG